MRYTFTKENLVAISKVIGWSLTSSLVATLILIVQQTDFPPEYSMLIPVINVILYSIKEYVSDK